MENSKHTPGPWKQYREIQRKPNAGDFWVKANDKTIVIIRDDFENAEANAKLIAAAPDMLEALTDALDELAKWKMCEDKNGGDDDLNQVVNVVKEAIQKATQ